MKKLFFLMGAIIVFTMTSCHHPHSTHNHEHEHQTSHTHKHKHGHEQKGQQTTTSDEIVISEQKAQEIGIVTEVVTPAPFRQVIRTGGHILAAQNEEVAIVANSSGIVNFSRTISAGTQVNAGATIMTLSASKLQNGDPIEHARIIYEKAKSEYERALPLAEKQIVTKNEIETLKANYESAKLNYDALSSGHSGQGAAIKTPISGFVKNIQVKEGDYVSLGQTLMTVSKNQRLQLQANVSERYYHSLSSITDANFKTPYDETIHSIKGMNGRLLSYAKSTGSNSYHIPVTFEFDNNGYIVPGSFVEVFLLGKQRDNVISLPTSALTEEQGTFFVYLKLDDECYHKQEVKVGTTDGQQTEILNGLRTGDCVVTKGAYHIKLASITHSIPGHSHAH